MEILATPPLYLASASLSRQKILSEIGIPFIAVGHTADESSCDVIESLEERVSAVSKLKMEHAQLPVPFSARSVIYVLSADTLTRAPDGVIYGKPYNRDEARKILLIKHERPSFTTTSFCLDKKVADGDYWKTIKRIQRTVSGQTISHVPEEWIDTYLDLSGALGASGALAIEGLGSLFVKEVSGSYSAVRGLPVFELREALEEIGFFKTFFGE